MSLAKVQQWLAARRAGKRSKGKQKARGGTEASAAVGVVPEIRESKPSEDLSSVRSRSSTVGSRPVSILVVTCNSRE